jgi:hypothetical protein
MHTTINGKPDAWGDGIRAKWAELWRDYTETPAGKGALLTDVTHANYYTPRPYQDQYSTGSREEGFVWVIHRRVINSVISRADRIVGAP